MEGCELDKDKMCNVGVTSGFCVGTLAVPDARRDAAEIQRVPCVGRQGVQRMGSQAVSVIAQVVQHVGRQALQRVLGYKLLNV